MLSESKLRVFLRKKVSLDKKKDVKNEITNRLFFFRVKAVLLGIDRYVKRLAKIYIVNT